MIEFKEKENGFEYIEIKNNSASAKIALQGAHIFHFQEISQDPLLWLSEKSEFKKGTAIRGGIPICWPAFGMNNPNLSQHGFARTSMFEFVDVVELDADATQIVLKLHDTKESRVLWDYKFELELKIIISNTLSLELITRNLDDKPFTITQALHTYFNISSISDAEISGLELKNYLDALTSLEHIQKGTIRFEEEVDRVYQDVDAKIVLKDKNKIVNIISEGSASAVVWNPWINKCSKMSAMDKEAYKEFLCIETANAFDDFKEIKPNQKYCLKAEYITLV